MYRQLLLTDLDANKTYMLLALAGNVFFFIFLGLRGGPVEDFMTATIIVYLGFLGVTASIGNEEKRLRLYSQLPLTSTEIWLGAWFVVLLWLGLQVGLWLLYGFIFDPDFSYLRAPELASSALGIVSFVILLAIAIDLFYFKPAFARWLYIGFLTILVAIAIQLDMSIGIVGSETGIQILPFEYWGEGRSQTAFSIVVVTVLLIADYYIYKNSDNYLR